METINLANVATNSETIWIVHHSRDTATALHKSWCRNSHSYCSKDNCKDEHFLHDGLGWNLKGIPVLKKSSLYMVHGNHTANLEEVFHSPKELIESASHIIHQKDEGGGCRVETGKGEN